MNYLHLLLSPQTNELMKPVQNHLYYETLSRYLSSNFIADLNKYSADEIVRMYIEDYIIPTLKEKLPDNAFIKYLCFGLKTDSEGKERGFYKLPFKIGRAHV